MVKNGNKAERNGQKQKKTNAQKCSKIGKKEEKNGQIL